MFGLNRWGSGWCVGVEVVYMFFVLPWSSTIVVAVQVRKCLLWLYGSCGAVVAVGLMSSVNACGVVASCTIDITLLRSHHAALQSLARIDVFAYFAGEMYGVPCRRVTRLVCLGWRWSVVNLVVYTRVASGIEPSDFSLAVGGCM